MKGIRRITIVEHAADGSRQTVAVGKKKKNKKKRSRGLKSAERNTRVVIEALQTYADELDGRHRKSARARKDGWLRDMNWNLFKASRKANKKLRKMRVF
jgi:hypothetical protein